MYEINCLDFFQLSFCLLIVWIFVVNCLDFILIVFLCFLIVCCCVCCCVCCVLCVVVCVVRCVLCFVRSPHFPPDPPDRPLPDRTPPDRPPPDRPKFRSFFFSPLPSQLSFSPPSSPPRNGRGIPCTNHFWDLSWRELSER